MSYTTERQPQGFPRDTPGLLRESLVSEIVAINDYEYIVANSYCKDINEVIRHIIEDEKEHYGIFLSLLRRYDPAQMEMLIEAEEHVQLDPVKCPLIYSPKYCQELLLNHIREGIKGELEAILLYEQQVCQIKHADVRDAYYRIIRQEKEHVEELTIVLLHYDRDTYGPLNADGYCTE